MGKDGFIWWMGVVEDRADPEQLGRVRVRIMGWHTDNLEEIPVDSLPWAMPVISPVISNVAHAPKEGEWVFGFFADGSSAQYPLYIGVLPGKPKTAPDTSKGFSDPNGVYPDRINESTLNRLSRNRKDGTIHETRERNVKSGIKSISTTWSEPAPTFAPIYPFNHAHESESGHAFELDDTEGNQRVHLAHNNGSYLEFTQDGSYVFRANKDRYSVILGTDYISVDGDCHITVGGNCNLKVIGKFNLEASEINMSATNAVRIKAGSGLKMEGKTVDLKAAGVMKVGAGGKLNLKGKSSTLQGKSVSLAGKVANKVKCPKSICKILPTGSASSPSNTGLKTP